MPGNYLKITAVILLSILLSSSFSITQDYSLRFDRIPSELGLSQGTIRAICQDASGFMWFGTDFGLNRFDGYEFKVFTRDFDDSSSISDDRIFALQPDRSGYLWIGTEKGGLNRYDPLTTHFTHFIHDPEDPNSISDNFVYSILEDSRGSIWAGTFSGGLNRFDASTGHFQRYQYSPDDPDGINDNFVGVLFEDSEGFIWAGTRSGGLNRYNPETDSFQHFTYDPADDRSLSDNFVLSIFEDSHGNLWIGTNQGGVNLFDRDSQEFTRYMKAPESERGINSNQIFAITEDKNGNLWFGTEKGLNRFEHGKKGFKYYSYDATINNTISNNNVRSLYMDDSGIVWIGTFSGLTKLALYREYVQHFIHDPDDENSISSNNVWSIYHEGSSDLWVGTGNGLNRLDKNSGKITRYYSDPDDPNTLTSGSAISITGDKAGTIWIGTEKGLNRLDSETGIITQFFEDRFNPESMSGDFVVTVFLDSHGDLWAGTLNGGLNRYNSDTGIFTRFLHNPDDEKSIINNSIYFLLESSKGELWIATSGGLERYDSDSNTFYHYLSDPADKSTLSSNRVTVIAEDDDGMLWIATRDNGLNKFDPENGRVTRFGTEHGLAKPAVKGLLKSGQQHLWLSSNDCLARFDLVEETFSNYPRLGIFSNLVFNIGAYYRSDEGELYFGGANGLYSFHPDSMLVNPQIPPVVITSVENRGSRIPLGEIIPDSTRIFIPYNNNYFTINFSALDYYQPDMNNYSCKLEGFDTDWIFLDKENHRSYANIPFGEYTFRVKGSNSSGTWNNEGASIRIIVKPPYWVQPWFVISSVLIFIAGVTVFHKTRMKIKTQSLKNSQNILEKEVRKRTAELQLYHEQLEEMVAYRTEELQKSNLLLTEEITERKNIEADLTKSQNLLLLLNEISSVFLRFSGERTYEEFLKLIIKSTESYTGLFCIIESMSGTEKWVSGVIRTADGDFSPVVPPEIEIEDIPCRKTARQERRPVFDNDITVDLKEFGQITKVMCVPLFHHDDNIGMIVLGNKKDDYHLEELELMNQVAVSISPVLNSRLAEEKGTREKTRLEHQLFQSQKMESIGRLAGGIAHDYNNILTTIMGNAEMLKLSSGSNLKLKEAADTIFVSSAKAAELTKQLLGFARGGKYNPVPLDINKIITESINMFGKILEKNIAVQKHLESDIDLIEADENQMHQVLGNLIVNAKDAITGKGVISFKTENYYYNKDLDAGLLDLEAGQYVKITISDTGSGMSAEVRKKIFDPFYSTKKTGEGTGLGLATVYGIVRNHHGQINVYSEPGEGSSFTLYFPVTTGKVEQKGKDPSVFTGKSSILVVDDEKNVAKILQSMLESLGYSVNCVYDGIEAVEYYREFHDTIDLVLMDIIMPNMDGGEAFNIIKEMDPDVKVVITSGFSSEMKASEILNNGAVGFIQKPARLAELSRVIRNALSQEAANRH